MRGLPNLSYREIIREFQRDGWVVVRQRGSHILRLAELEPAQFLNLL
ncbi:MAG: addiction module toxin, HicA family [Dehalococcoidia bacterium]|nr:addiction module toxin, HicA family [Dehalococcoidia bacterium]